MTQPVLPLLPAGARSVGPSAGLAEDPQGGGVVFVFGLATFGFVAGDEAGRRLAAVQLVTTRIASAAEVAPAFGVSAATLWRWVGAFRGGGVLALVRDRPGPRGASKLNAALAARIVALAATGLTLAEIAARTGVSTATVRVALGRVAPRTAATVEPAAAPATDDGEGEGVGSADDSGDDHDEQYDQDDDQDDDRGDARGDDDEDDARCDDAAAAELVVLAAPVPRSGWRPGSGTWSRHRW